MPLKLKGTDVLLTVTDADLTVFADIGEVAEDVTYTVKAINAEEVQRIRQPYLRRVLDRRTHQFREAELTPEEDKTIGEALIDAVLVDWVGVVGPEGPVPCTRENKMLLDDLRRTAIFQTAIRNQVVTAADKEGSFRQPSRLVAVPR